MAQLQLDDGTSIAYDDHRPGNPGTTGLPLLLVHGHPFDRSMWRPQAEHFARRGHRVVVPDLRGYGESSGPAVTSLAGFSRDLIALADQLGLAEFVLGGLSMGGQIVMQTVRDHPGRVSALLLADTFPTEETAEGKVARNAVADRLLVEGMARYADELLPKMVSAETLQNRPDVAKHVLTMMRDAPAEGAAAALRARAERPDYREVLEHLGVSTLVVVGSEDEFTPVSDAELMHRLVAGSALAVVRGVGHLPNLERAAEFNDVFGRFLDTLRLRPASGEER
ncbi:alpha/beta fold hydrolase [Amycolatopsis saalfeldensis]|uniref:Pimeloyl-ACP methyl ester carboxylesterase n=1 Tax=Amycolatopsis saalfeldensis TaxID=394193 RepID=A0A1H8YKN5_9PSEU|nr:alpha/beta hydrolase [Amycolatopsis saalfeldensis]SEP52716.1 Pimeloyl-ACP methyl ester carboxylesterase [Amycolatopsis saalfeldensis]